MATWEISGPRQLALDGEVGELVVWLAHGKLRVVGTDGPARLEITGVGTRGVTVSLEDGTLSVRHGIAPTWWGKLGPFWWFLSGRRKYRAEVTIAVPTTCAAHLTLVSGSVFASGLRRGGQVEVTSGSITLMGLGGQVRAKTVSGSIQALGMAGDVRLETVSGDISVAESPADRVAARTISGAITCDLDNPFAREVRLDTTSGEIAVRVPEDADLDVSLSATSGRVTSAFHQVRPAGRHGVHLASGRLGSGTGTLRAFAVSGTVSLLSRPAADHPAGPERTGPDPTRPEPTGPDPTGPGR